MNPSENHSIPARVGQIAVPVADVDRAVDFYENILGLRLLFRAPPGLAFFDCGGVRLMLSRPEGPAAPSRAGIIYYVVADLAAAYARLRERGVEFLEPPRCIARAAFIASASLSPKCTSRARP